MHCSLQTFVYLLPLMSPTAASPVDLPPYLKCHCITFPTSTSSSPCQIAGSQNLDWHSARAFAASHDLQIQFANKDTVSKVLDSRHPLPTSLLLLAGQSDQNPYYPLPNPNPGPVAGKQDSAESRVVCGVDDAVRKAWMKEGELDPKMCDISILQVVLVLILLVVGFEALDTIWVSIRHIFSKKAAPIRLSGSEKSLAAMPEETEEVEGAATESISELEGDKTEMPETVACLAQKTFEVHSHIALPRDRV
ncbi:hypothetical protein BCR34DRAFT_324014 [Clohesyomyces aquaticus]|uniref:Uncharacterized protein n=1 Tax=Clohesyomyces aquaticus TaxID=1231657 RepID=A0A1Y1ZMQ5_9PLEO|nr:hypothetical protein BCR34DRAFT_324014 [Clohesyomyces aquaticus]